MPQPRIVIPASPSAARSPRRGAHVLTHTPETHHHQSADELALEEAAELVGLPERGTPRDRRHRRLEEAREAAEHEHELAQGHGHGRGAGGEGGDERKKDEDGDKNEEEEGEDGVDLEEVPQEGQGMGPAPMTVGAGAAGSSPGRSSPDSSDDSDSEEDSDDSTSEEDEDSDTAEDEAWLEEMLDAARRAEERKAQLKAAEEPQVFGQEEDGLLALPAGVEGRKLAPIPDMAIGSLPQAPLSFGQDGRARAQKVVPAVQAPAGPSRPRSRSRHADEAGRTLEPDNLPYERELSKREKAAIKKPTTSELWGSMPAARADSLPQMRKDYQALALASSLDPKRHMKGGTKLNRVPETFAIGTLIDPPRHLQDTTLSSGSRYRPGDVVKSLVRDEEVGSYAKRKYGDLQWHRMENGRGKGWKKKPKWW